MAVTNVSVVGGSLFARVDAALGGGHRPAFVAASIATLSVLVLVRRLGHPGPNPSAAGELSDISFEPTRGTIEKNG
jgi:hypothetical protein